MALALLSPGFQSLPLLPTGKLGPCDADSQVSGFVYVLGPCGSLQWILLWGWEFLPLLQPTHVLRLYFPGLELWVVWSVSLPSCSFWFIHVQVWVFQVCQPLPHLPWSSSCHLAASPLCPSCLSLPFLLVWMNVSSLTLWLLDFHIVQFSGSSGCSLFLNLLLSFFWLCKETQCTTYVSILARNPRY